MGVHLILSRKKQAKKEVYQEVSLDNRLVRIYLSLLKTALRNPAPTIIGVLILFFGTIITTLAVSVNQLSELETQQITLYVTMPTGTTLDATDALVSGMEQALMEIKEHEEVISRIEEEEATVTILLQDDYQKIVELIQQQLQKTRSWMLDQFVGSVFIQTCLGL